MDFLDTSDEKAYSLLNSNVVPTQFVAIIHKKFKCQKDDLYFDRPIFQFLIREVPHEMFYDGMRCNYEAVLHLYTTASHIFVPDNLAKPVGFNLTRKKDPIELRDGGTASTVGVTTLILKIGKY